MRGDDHAGIVDPCPDARKLFAAGLATAGRPCPLGSPLGDSRPTAGYQPAEAG
jgi:hypothetical protein